MCARRHAQPLQDRAEKPSVREWFERFRRVDFTALSRHTLCVGHYRQWPLESQPAPKQRQCRTNTNATYSRALASRSGRRRRAGCGASQYRDCKEDVRSHTADAAGYGLDRRRTAPRAQGVVRAALSAARYRGQMTAARDPLAAGRDTPAAQHTNHARHGSARRQHRTQTTRSRARHAGSIARKPGAARERHAGSTTRKPRAAWERHAGSTTRKPAAPGTNHRRRKLAFRDGVAIRRPAPARRGAFLQEPLPGLRTCRAVSHHRAAARRAALSGRQALFEMPATSCLR